MLRSLYCIVLWATVDESLRLLYTQAAAVADGNAGHY